MGVRSSVKQLPEDIRGELDQALIAGDFSGYTDLVNWLSARGHAISKSSLHRYGSRLQSRLDKIREATLEARAICAEHPDDGTEVAEATLKLAQQRLFDLLMASDSGDATEIVAAAKAVADGARAGVSLRKARAQAIEDEHARQKKKLADAGQAGQLDPVAAQRALDLLGLG